MQNLGICYFFTTANLSYDQKYFPFGDNTNVTCNLQLFSFVQRLMYVHHSQATISYTFLVADYRLSTPADQLDLIPCSTIALLYLGFYTRSLIICQNKLVCPPAFKSPYRQNKLVCPSTFKSPYRQNKLVCPPSFKSPYRQNKLVCPPAFKSPYRQNKLVCPPAFKSLYSGLSTHIQVIVFFPLGMQLASTEY